MQSMSEATERLERLIADEVGQCRAGDVESRLSDLDELVADATGPETRTDVAALATLGDETRYRLTRVLAAADDELCVCELDAAVGVSSSAVSHALGDLADVGLVTTRRDGTWRYYRTTERAERLLRAVDETREGSA